MLKHKSIDSGLSSVFTGSDTLDFICSLQHDIVSKQKCLGETYIFSAQIWSKISLFLQRLAFVLELNSRQPTKGHAPCYLIALSYSTIGKKNFYTNVFQLTLERGMRRFKLNEIITRVIKTTKVANAAFSKSVNCTWKKVDINKHNKFLSYQILAPLSRHQNIKWKLFYLRHYFAFLMGKLMALPKQKMVDITII